ncbi:MAG: FimV/HubP family polar landmark protein, partial [Chromatocurvus sp.]
MAKRVHLSSAVLIGGLLHAGTLSALGLGDITLKSYLNEPLDAEVRLIDTRDLAADEIKVRLAGVDDFDRMGVDRSYFLTRIQFEVRIDRDRNTGVIRLTTSEPVREPFVDVIIEARWPTGRLLREYTVLVDPPVFREAPLVVSASEEVAAVERAGDESDTAPAPQAESGGGRGDRLETRRSDLPAGEMPQRAFSAETADAPAPGRRYMVRRDETLWQIASRGRPEGSSVQQAMLDIQRLNPEAFIDGNINRIKAGYIVYLPAQGDISSDDLSEALAEVQEQNARWANQQSRTPGVTAAASLRISADPVVDEPDDGGVGTLIADADAGGAAQDAAAQAPAEEAADPASARSAQSGRDASETADGASAQSELAVRMAEMSERLDTLEQIVALKDEQIATLEQALRDARASAPRTPETATAQPSERPAAPTPAAESSGGFGAWLYAVAAAVLVVLAGLLFWRRRRAADDDEGLEPGTGRD